VPARGLAPKVESKSAETNAIEPIDRRIRADMMIVLSGRDGRNVIAKFARNAMQIRQTCDDCG